MYMHIISIFALGLRKEFINNFVFSNCACAAGFNNNKIIKTNHYYIYLFIIIIIIKRGRQCKAGRERFYTIKVRRPQALNTNL